MSGSWSWMSCGGNIGMATQDVLLFSDTIDGNIAYGDPDLPEEDAKAYAALAAAHDFIVKMPEGYDTVVGERGVGLSGGPEAADCAGPCSGGPTSDSDPR
ncbi:hypothetical protein ACFSQ7_45950 [Paenibacillus rhizoplanae]